MKKLNNKGFTLVELLATIAILAIVTTITLYVSTDVVGKSKEKSYVVTVNNIEKKASNYLFENSNRLFFVGDLTNNIEYQCVSVQNLIDAGYFDESVLESPIDENNKVDRNLYVYLERDIDTKSINKNVLVTPKNASYYNYCKNAIESVTGNINIDITEADKFSKTKEATITYRVKNAQNLSDYEYTYNYDEGEYKVIDDSQTIKKIMVTTNGNLIAKISAKDKIITSKNLLITKIDNTGPTITLGNYPVNSYVRDNVVIPLNVSDSQSGLDKTSFTKNDIVVTIGGVEVTNILLDVNYNLTINNDNKLSGEIAINIGANKVLDILGNGNTAINLKPSIMFDNIAPVITLGTNGNSTYAKSASSKITVSDEESGVDAGSYKYVYSISSTAVPSTTFVNESTYSQSTGNGKYYLRVAACDKAGNCSTITSNAFYLDNTVPVITLGTNGNSTYAKSVSSKITVIDSESGVDTGSYKYIYSTSSTATPTTIFTSGNVYSQSTGNGKYYLRATACDKAGNCSTITSNAFNLDNVNPDCKLTATTSGVTFENKTDNLKLISYGMNTTDSAIYNNTSSLSLATGTFNGYVKDEAGNVNKCSLVIKNNIDTSYCSTGYTMNSTKTSCYKAAQSTTACPDGYESFSTGNCYKTTNPILYTRAYKKCVPYKWNITEKTCKKNKTYKQTTITCNYNKTLRAYWSYAYKYNLANCSATNSFTCYSWKAGSSYITCTETASYAYAENYGADSGETCVKVTAPACSASNVNTTYRTGCVVDAMNYKSTLYYETVSSCTVGSAPRCLLAADNGNNYTTSCTAKGCPAGYNLSSGTCYAYKDKVTSCPAGYSLSSGTCYAYSSVLHSYSCGVGETAVGNYCYVK